MILQVSYFCV